MCKFWTLLLECHLVLVDRYTQIPDSALVEPPGFSGQVYENSGLCSRRASWLYVDRYTQILDSAPGESPGFMWTGIRKFWTLLLECLLIWTGR
jgi:hypothetical protein